MNKIINFGVDEDGICDVEIIENVNGFKWLGFMVMGEVKELSCLGEGGGRGMGIDLDEVFKECLKGVNCEDDVEMYKEKFEVFKECLSDVLNGNVMVRCYVWSVEYDWNIGILLSDF